MLKRKIETILKDWRKNKNRKPLIIKGVRQCGKTFSVLKFANENYKNVVYVNFVENPDLKLAFYGSKTVDNIVMYLSAQIQGSVFPAQETCLVLDELQECPEARTALKFFKIDGRFDVICTGSLLGVKGYETIVDMYPLDF